MRNSEKTPGNTFPAERPIFYYITERRSLAGEGLLTRIRRVVDWGADFVQIREKDLPDSELFALAAQAAAAAAGSRCRVLVNGRADIAMAAGAHGVHLPSAGLRPQDLLVWLPKGFLVGVSVHSLRQAASAAVEGADYALLGPLFATPSKAAYGSPLGLRLLRRACKTLSLPILGLGGIGPTQVDAVIEAGAAGVAGIRLFQHQLGRRVRTFRE